MEASGTTVGLMPALGTLIVAGQRFVGSATGDLREHMPRLDWRMEALEAIIVQ